MSTINNAETLKEAILLMEAEQTLNGQILKEQFRLTYESLKPINIIKEAMHDFSESPDGISNIMGTGMGLLTGFLSKKVFVGNSGNIFRKLIGSFLQFGVTNAVANHSDAIKKAAKLIFQQILHSKNRKSEDQEE